MKKISIFGLALLFSFLAFSQNDVINYKALISDGSGTILSSEVVSIRFTIFSDALQLYQETHSTTTDANGIAIVNIGAGSTSDNFSAIDWSSGVATLRTEIDSGSGFVDIGTTEFKSVPYALNVSGLEAIDEGNGRGWRLKRDLPSGIFAAIGGGSIDFSTGTNLGIGAIGNGAFAIGLDNTGGGNFSFVGGVESSTFAQYSFAFGNNVETYGSDSAAFGNQSRAFGNGSFASGDSSEAVGSYASAFNRGISNGNYASAFNAGFSQGNESAAFNFGNATGNSSAAFNESTSGSFLSFAIGRDNVGGGSTTTWVATDPLFEIGNGNGGAPSNALTVLKTGKTTVNHSGDSENIDHALSGIKTVNLFNDAAGVYGQNTATDYYGYGVYGEGGYMGVRGQVTGTGTGGGVSYFGVYGDAFGGNGGTNYGVYGFASGGAINNYAVYAAGDLAHTGALINASDRKLKSNIQTLSGALESIEQLNPTSYSIKPSYIKKMNMPSGTQVGFIAQEIQQIFPNLVTENIHPGASKNDPNIEYLGVNYIGLIPVLTAGIKEQQQIIEQQQQTIDAQQALLQDLMRRVEALENRD